MQIGKIEKGKDKIIVTVKELWFFRKLAGNNCCLLFTIAPPIFAIQYK